MTEATERGTGRTQRMLEAAVACEDEQVVVFVHDKKFVHEIVGRLVLLVGGEAVVERGYTVIREDGRRIHVRVASDAARFLVGRPLNMPAFVDHYVWKSYEKVPDRLIDHPGRVRKDF